MHSVRDPGIGCGYIFEMQKKVLITGASEGIGRQFAVAFAKQNYAVSLVARNESRLVSLVKELPGSNHNFLVADLSTSHGLGDVLAMIAQNEFDVLINNAGVGGLGAFDASPIRRHEEMLHLNINSLMFISHAFLSKASSGSALINVSSVLSYLPSPYHAVYTATKAFVKSFSEGLWYEQQEKGIYVMALCPGATATKFTSRAGGAADRIPHWIMQSPEDVVREAMHELTKRSKPVVITGRVNRFIYLMTKIIPNKNLLQANGKQTAARLLTK